MAECRNRQTLPPGNLYRRLQNADFLTWVNKFTEAVSYKQNFKWKRSEKHLRRVLNMGGWRPSGRTSAHIVISAQIFEVKRNGFALWYSLRERILIYVIKMYFATSRTGFCRIFSVCELQRLLRSLCYYGSSALSDVWVCGNIHRRVCGSSICVRTSGGWLLYSRCLGANSCFDIGCRSRDFCPVEECTDAGLTQA